MDAVVTLALVAIVGLSAARWLAKDARRRDLDPQSQVRSDWLEFLEDERSGKR